MTDYPVDLRAEYPERSSRGWAIATIIIFVKFFALLPHWIILIFLGIAQFVVAIVAQVVVVTGGEYPEGMFEFNVGVMRWGTRVTAFFFSLTDRYPPFTLRPDPAYPIDVLVERQPSYSRMYALFTLLVEVLAIIGGIALLVWFVRHTGSANSTSSRYSYFRGPSSGASGLLLRDIVAIPHLIILGVLGIVTGIIWVIVQWVILFVGYYPRGMWDFVVGVTRWQTRVNAYTLGLNDSYPPFTFDPSLTAAAPAAPYPQGGAPLAPPPPPPPAPYPGASGSSTPPAAAPPAGGAPQPQTPQPQTPPPQAPAPEAPTPRPDAPPAPPTPPPPPA